MSQRQSQLIFTKPDEKHISSEKRGEHSHKRDIPEMCPEHLQSGNVLTHSVLQKAGCNSEFFLFLPPSIRKKVKFAVYIGCSYKTQVPLHTTFSQLIFTAKARERLQCTHNTGSCPASKPTLLPTQKLPDPRCLLTWQKVGFFSPGSISFHR